MVLSTTRSSAAATASRPPQALMFWTFMVTFPAPSVEAYTVIRTNLALKGNASQSSTYLGLVASKAVDGSVANGDKHCAVTTKDDTLAWWSVAFSANPVAIHVVTVTFTLNRPLGDQHSDKWNLYVGNASATGKLSSDGHYQLCKTLSNAKSNTVGVYNCNGIMGSSIYIVNPEKDSYLAVCEVEVSTYPLSKTEVTVAFGVVEQSSDASPSTGASLAVDDSPHVDFCRGSCTETAEEWEPWLRVRLGRVYTLRSVSITNRDDNQGVRIFGAQIRVENSKADGSQSNALCAGDVFVPPGWTQDVSCSSLPIGDSVSIVIPARVDSLSLCDLKLNLDPMAIAFNILY